MITSAQKEQKAFISSARLAAGRFDCTNVSSKITLIQQFLPELRSLLGLSLLILLFAVARPALAQEPTAGPITIVGNQFVPHVRGAVVCCDDPATLDVIEGQRDGFTLAYTGPLTTFATWGINITHFRTGPYSDVKDSNGELINPNYGVGDAILPALRQQVTEANALGIYVEVDLIDYWAIKDPSRNWWNDSCDITTKAPEPKHLDWVKRVVDATGDKHVLYNLGNEAFECKGAGQMSAAWEQGLYNAVKAELEANRGNRSDWDRPVGSQFQLTSNLEFHPRLLFDYVTFGDTNPADYVRALQAGKVPREKPVMLVESDGGYHAPSEWHRHIQDAEREGAYIMVWRGDDMTDADFVAAIDPPICGHPRITVRPTLQGPTGCFSSPRNPTFNWTAVDGADDYKLALFESTSDPGNDPLLLYQATPDTSLALPFDLTLEKRYRWKVKARNCQGDGPFSRTGYFTLSTDCRPPVEPPVLAGPQGCVDLVRPIFSWSVVAKATSYRVIVSLADHDDFIVNEVVNGTTLVSPIPLIPKIQYRFKVKALNDAGDGPYSPSMYFTPFCGGVASLITAPLGCINTTTPTFTWQAVPPAVQYWLLVGDNPDFSNPSTTWLVNEHLTGTSLSPGVAFNPGQTYYSKVKTILDPSSTLAAAWSPTVSFTPFCPRPPAPAGLVAAVGNSRVTLTWAPSAGAIDYNVKRSTTSGGPYVTIAGGMTTTGYTDLAVSNGTTYYYVVSANTSQGESSNSNEALATPSPNPPVPVAWVNGHGVAINGNNLTRNDPNAGWFTGAASKQAIAFGDGYVEFTASETNTYRMAGLSRGDANQSYPDIDFAIYPAADGNLYVYESGVYKAALGPYAGGDRLRVSVEAGAVRYRRNGALLYTSTATPSYPLLVDSSLYSPGATIANAVIFGALTGNQAPVANAGGPYTGVTGSPISFSGAASWDPEGVIVSYLWDFGDGSTGSGITATHAYAAMGNYTVTLTIQDDGGLSSTATTTVSLAQPVQWISALGVTVNGNSLTKSDPNGGWYAGAASQQTIVSGDAFVEFTASESNTYRMLGLSNGNTDQTYWDIDFAIYPAADGNLYVYEAGAYKAALGPYAAGDRLRVSVESGAVRYRKNGELLYASTVAPTYPLLVDTSFYSPGATISNAVVAGNLAPPDPTGTPVNWINSVGVTISGNSLTKSDPNGGWYAGAASRQTFASGDGYVEFTANETNTYRMVGLSNGDSDQTYWDIDFAIYPAADGNLYIYEAGVYKAALGPYVNGDRLRVSVEAGVVKYRKNGWPLYTSTVAPTYPLLVDTSFYTPGAIVNNAVVVGNWGP